jgi:two-component system, sensor histidine kinase YesM
MASILSYNKLSKSMYEELDEKANMILNQNVKAINFFMNDIERMGKMISTDSTISDFLSHHKRDRTYYQYFLKLDPIISNIGTIRPENVGITLINDSNLVYYYGYSLNKNNNTFENFSWLPDINSLNYKSTITALHNRSYVNNHADIPVFSYIKKIWSQDLQSYGILIIDFNIKIFQQLFSQASEEDSPELLLLDQNDNIIFSSHPQNNNTYQTAIQNSATIEITENTIEFNEKTYYYITLQLEGTDWKIISLFEKSKLYASLIDSKHIVLSILGASLIICIIFSLLISHKLSNPIKQLLFHMKLVEEGNFRNKLKIDRKDEFGDLGRGFNNMIVKIGELVERVFKEQEAKKRTEIMALQAQINPHFLYNTLELINSFARKNNQPEISKLIVLLAKLLRFSISTFEEFVTIQQETEYAKSYLEINKLRVRKPFVYQILLKDDIGNLLTIKWILQPIIENAIIHGTDKNQNGGMIEIKGWSEGEVIYLSVKDNGVGISTNKLVELQKKLDIHLENHTKNNKNIGLYNVQSRIRLTYGGKYGLNITSAQGKGTTVLVKIPRRENNE